MDKVKAFLRKLNDARKAFRDEHKLVHDGIVLALAFLALGFVWGRVYAAVYNCSGTIPGTLTCTEQGTPPPGGGTPPVTPPVTPPPINQYANCPAGTLVGGDVWGLTNVTSATLGAFGDGQILVYRVIATQAMASARNSTWAYGAGGSPAREFSLTTQACDFSGATAVGNSYSPATKINGMSPTPQFYYRAGTTVGGQVNIEVGKSYYLNFRNPLGSCPSGNCVLIGSMPK